ncbi:VOC family protein [Nocardioides sp.]|uniref:VOC family protein n=1 Tax=Nocardioides sp. TaxID=35761 RepID=UPI003D14E70E
MIRASAVVIDVNDLAGETEFWAGLLGSSPVRSGAEDWLDVAPLGGGLMLSLQLVGERKTHKNRLHLDLEVADFAATRDLAVRLGALPVSDVHEPGQPWQVFADPEGNEFCLISVAAVEPDDLPVAVE